mmetsp:Transcript_16249/g.35229  ORF Transcript_16249/g.35229 Transcript_16249/m.35229 type:complete len:382 (-) Transcript_16249:313-1458(-)
MSSSRSSYRSRASSGGGGVGGGSSSARARQEAPLEVVTDARASRNSGRKAASSRSSNTHSSASASSSAPSRTSKPTASRIGDDDEIEMVTDARAGGRKGKTGGGGGLLKKKNAKLAAGHKGGVVDLDLDSTDPNTTSMGSHGRAAAGRTRAQTTAQMSAMDREALRLAEESSESTKRSRAKVLETYEVGSATATKLSEQTEQLGRIQDDLIDTNASLDRADKIIHELDNPFTSKFTPAPKSKKENQLKSSKMRANGEFVRTPVEEVPVVQLDDLLSGKGLPPPRSAAKEREELLGGSKGGRGSNSNGTGTNSTEERLRQLREEQDEDIRAIGSTVAGLKGMAIQMNAELKTQEELIEAVDHDTEVVNRRLQKNTRKVKQLK